VSAELTLSLRFGFAHRPERQSNGSKGRSAASEQRRNTAANNARDAHNLYLETLAELGPVGLALLLIALGAVIRGDTYHFEIVSSESASGISAVALDCGIPIANGILTTETDEQADVRAAQKGRDCAEAAVEMANLARSIDRQHR